METKKQILKAIANEFKQTIIINESLFVFFGDDEKSIFRINIDFSEYCNCIDDAHCTHLDLGEGELIKSIEIKSMCLNDYSINDFSTIDEAIKIAKS